jgi:hypothetical protein
MYQLSRPAAWIHPIFLSFHGVLHLEEATSVGYKLVWTSILWYIISHFPLSFTAASHLLKYRSFLLLNHRAFLPTSARESYIFRTHFPSSSFQSYLSYILKSRSLNPSTRLTVRSHTKMAPLHSFALVSSLLLGALAAPQPQGYGPPPPVTTPSYIAPTQSIPLIVSSVVGGSVTTIPIGTGTNGKSSIPSYRPTPFLPFSLFQRNQEADDN